MNKHFSIVDFNFPFVEEWIDFVQKYPMRQLNNDAHIKMSLFDWLLVGNELVDDLWADSDGEIYNGGAAYIYGACLCFLFSGYWHLDEKSCNYSVRYNALESWRVISYPMLRLEQLNYNPASEKLIQIIIIDCFYTHLAGRFEVLPTGHPVFQFYNDEETCSLSTKAKTLLKEASLDVFDLLRLSLDLSFWGFDSITCSKEIESNPSLLSKKVNPTSQP